RPCAGASPGCSAAPATAGTARRGWSPAVLTRGDDPQELPAAPTRGGDPPEPPVVLLSRRALDGPGEVGAARGAPGVGQADPGNELAARAQGILDEVRGNVREPELTGAE